MRSVAVSIEPGDGGEKPKRSGLSRCCALRRRWESPWTARGQQWAFRFGSRPTVVLPRHPPPSRPACCHVTHRGNGLTFQQRSSDGVEKLPAHPAVRLRTYIATGVGTLEVSQVLEQSRSLSLCVLRVESPGVLLARRREGEGESDQDSEPRQHAGDGDRK